MCPPVISVARAVRPPVVQVAGDGAESAGQPGDRRTQLGQPTGRLTGQADDRLGDGVRRVLGELQEDLTLRVRPLEQVVHVGLGVLDEHLLGIR